MQIDKFHVGTRENSRIDVDRLGEGAVAIEYRDWKENRVIRFELTPVDAWRLRRDLEEILR